MTVNEPKSVLRDSIIASRESMSAAYQKQFTPVESAQRRDDSISYETEEEVCLCGRIFFDVHSTTVLKDSSIFLYVAPRALSHA